MAVRDLRYEGMRELVAQHSRKRRSHAHKAGNRNTNLSIIQRRRPGWRLGYIKESLLGIEGNGDIPLRRHPKIALQGVVLSFEYGKNVVAQRVRRLRAFVAQHKMIALLLPEFRFRLRSE